MPTERWIRLHPYNREVLIGHGPTPNGRWRVPYAPAYGWWWWLTKPECRNHRVRHLLDRRH